jgi:heat shock protein HslJ
VLRLLALAALLVVTGCAASADAGQPPDVLGSWALVSGESAGSALPLPAGATATLVLEEDRLSGQAFCNNYFAGYRLDGTTLTVEDIGQTEMGCEPDVMAAEQAYTEALAAVDTATMDGDELTLTGGAVTLRFTRQVPEPDRALTGTRWVLDTLVDVETVSSVQGEPTLQLAADGTAAFTTGCNGTTGRWRQSGDVLTVEPGASTLGGCDPSIQAQDRHVTDVLTAGATVTVDGDRLTLTAPDARALGYRAT